MTFPHKPDDDELEDARDRASQLRSFVGLAWVALFVLGAVFVVDRIIVYYRTVQCLESGRSNCVPLDVNQLPPADTTPPPSIDRLRDPWNKSKAPEPARPPR